MLKRQFSRIRRERLVPPAIDDAEAVPDYEESIKRINSITSFAKNTWFGLLGVLVFAGITLLNVQDVDFFAVNSSTKLPLVNVSVPVEAFFWAGATLVAALYVYFHLYLELLWAALGKAPARISGDPLSERITPWLVNEWALRRRDGFAFKRAWVLDEPEPERSAANRSFGFVGSLMSIMLVWVFGLAVLYYFWSRSLPAHNEWMSLWLGFLFVFSLWIAWRSLGNLWLHLTNLSSDDADENVVSGKDRGTLKRYAQFALFVVAMGFYTLLRTGSDWFPGEHAEWKDYPVEDAAEWIKLARKQDDEGKPDRTEYWQRRWVEADTIGAKLQYFVDIPYTELFSQNIAQAELIEAQIVAIPEDWLARNEAENEFRAQWAKRENLTYADPFPVIPRRNIEREFQWALLEARDKGIVALSGNGNRPDEKAFRVRWAQKHGIAVADPFPPAEQRKPEDDFGIAWKARRKTYLDTKPKPDLENRNLRHADLSGAFLPGVKLEKAKLEGADFSAARLEGANLSYARLEGAELRGASLEGADLSGANLESADLVNASLESANLSNAGLERADLSGASLERVDLVGARLEGASLRNASLEGSNFLIASLESADLTNTRLEKANLHLANLEGAILIGARLEGVDLTRARLEGADLRGARLEGADLSGARLVGADLRGARLFGNADRSLVFGTNSLGTADVSSAALRVADLSRVDVAKLENWNETFGDDSVKLPNGANRPARWCEGTLDDKEYFGRWRGYLDPNGSLLLNEQFNDHPPIPPSDC